MAITIANDPPLLSVDGNGRVRLAGMRVYLEFIVGAFRDGMTAEQIAEYYDMLGPGDVYTALGYYLRHKAEVDAYVDEYEAIAAANEARGRATQPTREELLARLAAKRAAECTGS